MNRGCPTPKPSFLRITVTRTTDTEQTCTVPGTGLRNSCEINSYNFYSSTREVLIQVCLAQMRKLNHADVKSVAHSCKWQSWDLNLGFRIGVLYHMLSGARIPGLRHRARWGNTSSPLARRRGQLPVRSFLGHVLCFVVLSHVLNTCMEICPHHHGQMAFMGDLNGLNHLLHISKKVRKDCGLSLNGNTKIPVQES